MVRETLTPIPHIMIGQPVFYFEPVRDCGSEIVPQESIVYGVFVHKSEGELYYFLEEKECPAYAVALTKEEIDEKIKAFCDYRSELAKASEENQKRFRALREGFILPEYSLQERVAKKTKEMNYHGEK
jgi:L-rhamnose mutarotase